MPTTTSLNLQALLKTAAARTGMDESAPRVYGLSPSAQAMYVAIQANTRRNALCVVVVPDDVDEVRWLAPDGARALVAYPTDRDVLDVEDLAIDFEAPVFAAFAPAPRPR